VGYNAESMECCLNIEKEKVLPAYFALEAHLNEEPERNKDIPISGFAYEEPDKPAEALIELISSHTNLQFYHTKTGNVESDYRENSKWGDWESQTLFTLGPFMENGSYIEYRGEDDSFWKYKFEDSACTEYNGHIEWE
jgi:hypothetical protein